MPNGINAAIESNRTKRFFARFIDGIIIGVPFMFLYIPIFMNFLDDNPGAFDLDPVTGELSDPDITAKLMAVFIPITILSIVVQLGYEYLMLRTKSATLGKMVFGLHVVNNETGQPISESGGAGKRTLGYLLLTFPYISGLVGLVNAVMVLVSPHRSVMDHIAGTRVASK